MAHHRKYKKFPGMKLSEPSTLTRLKLDCQWLESLGYVGLLDQVNAWGKTPTRLRIAQAQNIVTGIITEDLEVKKDKVVL